MKIEWKSCVRVGFSAFLLYLAVQYWHGLVNFGRVLLQAATPLLIGCVLAYLVNILMSFYERKLVCPRWGKKWEKARRPVCMLLAILTFVLIGILLARLILPQISSCFQILVGALPEAIDSAFRWLDGHLEIGEWLETQMLSIPTDQAGWEELARKAINIVVNGVGGMVNVVVTAATSLLGSVINLFISLIFMIYILMGKEKLGGQFRRVFRRVFGAKMLIRADDVLKVLDNCFHSYVVGQCIEACILGGLCALGMMLLRLPYAVMIGALIGITALVPIAGAYIGGAIGVIMIFAVSPMQSLIFLVFLLILQQFEGNVIYPRTVGTSLGLPGIWVLTAVTIGGAVMGITGMLVFVPLTAAAYTLLGRYVRKGENDKLQELENAVPKE